MLSPMNILHFVRKLFSARPNAPWTGYVFPALVSLLFGLGAFDDDGLTGTLPYAAILLICVIQLRYRTVIGWVTVIVSCVAYTVAVAFHPGNGPTNEYVFFLLMGLVPLASLIGAHPFRKSRGKIPGQPT